MAPIVHSVEISRRPEDVFAYVTDPSRFTEWQEAVVRANVDGPGPLAPGSKLSLTRRIGRREQTMIERADRVQPAAELCVPRRSTARCGRSGTGSSSRWTTGRRTRFTFELDFEGHGIGKLLVPLVVRRQAAKELPESHAHLKKRLERGA